MLACQAVDPLIIVFDRLQQGTKQACPGDHGGPTGVHDRLVLCGRNGLFDLLNTLSNSFHMRASAHYPKLPKTPSPGNPATFNVVNNTKALVPKVLLPAV